MNHSEWCCLWYLTWPILLLHATSLSTYSNLMDCLECISIQSNRWEYFEYLYKTLKIMALNFELHCWKCIILGPNVKTIIYVQMFWDTIQIKRNECVKLTLHIKYVSKPLRQTSNTQLCYSVRYHSVINLSVSWGGLQHWV